MADWSLLPNDLLYQITTKLDTIEEMVYFSCVCRTWNNVSSEVKTNWIAKMSWLLLAEDTQDNPEFLRKVFSPVTNKCYRLKLPQTFGARCWGSAYGWIVILSLDRSIQLFNPVTNAQVRLPSADTLPYKRNAQDCNEWMRRSFVKQLHWLRIPRKDDGFEFVAFAIHGDVYFLAFARPGDKQWMPMTMPRRANNVEDVVSYNGMVFVLHSDGEIQWFDLKGNVCVQMGYAPPPPPKTLEALRMDINSMYMVELGGDLHVVLRYKSMKEEEHDPNLNPYYDTIDFLDYDTIDFEVFRLDIKTQVWHLVRNLGDIALLVGSNPTIPLTMTKDAKMKRNSIYFTDDEHGFWQTVKKGGGHDMGVFDVESEAIVPFYQGSDGDIRSFFGPPIWFLPTF